MRRSSFSALTAFLLGTCVWTAGSLLSQAPAVGGRIPDRPESLLSGSVAPFQVPYDRVVERRLANGLTLVAVEDSTVPLVDIAIAVRAGSVLDVDAASVDDQRKWSPTPGVMEITASMLRRGGTAEVEPEEIDRFTEARGMSIRSFGGRHRSGVLGSATTEDFDQLAKWVSEVLTRPGFDSSVLARVRSSTLAGLSVRYNNATALAEREWNRLVLGNNTLRGRPLLPTDIERWTQQNLRSAHRYYYRPEETVIAIAGGVSPTRALDRFAELLGDWKAESERPSPRDRSASSARSTQAPPGFYQAVKNIPQGTLMMGHMGTERRSWLDAEAEAALLLGEILAGPGPVSRLRGRLRDRDGLVYSVSASVGVGASERGVVQIVWHVDPDNATAALGAALEELRRLREQPPPQQELDIARSSLIDALPSLFDTAEEIAGRYAEDVLLGRPHEFWQRYADRLGRITPAQVQAAARNLLRPSDLRAVWIGPRLETRALKRLGFSRVEELPDRDPVTLLPVDRQRR